MRFTAHDRPLGQAVKTSPFHGGNMGSIPVGVTNLSLIRIFHKSIRVRLIFLCLFLHYGNFMPQKPLEMRKGRVRLSCQRQTKSPLWAGGLALCLTNTPLRGSCQADCGINCRMRYTTIKCIKIKRLSSLTLFILKTKP